MDGCTLFYRAWCTSRVLVLAMTRVHLPNIKNPVLISVTFGIMGRREACAKPVQSTMCARRALIVAECARVAAALAVASSAAAATHDNLTKNRKFSLISRTCGANRTRLAGTLNRRANINARCNSGVFLASHTWVYVR